jgi:hypothetical protein
MQARLRRAGANLLLLGGASLAALVLAELVLRWHSPDSGFGAAEELRGMREGGAELGRLFTVDPEFGFRPVLGGELYGAHGTLRNDYPLDKRAGRARLLFVGDSVTARGRIVDALQEVYGRERLEFWNAGVESFGTVQEVAFYRRYNAAIQPDQVILTFHLNDFETTPIAFRDAEGRLVVFAPNQPARRINRWLFEHSRLYRVWLALVQARGGDYASIADEVRESLAELQGILEADGIRLTVLVLPLMKPYAEWTPQERGARATILGILRQQRIRYFDLLAPLEQAIRRGVAVQEHSGDAWHPSAEVSREFARHLRAQGLL